MATTKECLTYIADCDTPTTHTTCISDTRAAVAPRKKLFADYTGADSDEDHPQVKRLCHRWNSPLIKFGSEKGGATVDTDPYVSCDGHFNKDPCFSCNGHLTEDPHVSYNVHRDDSISIYSISPTVFGGQGNSNNTVDRVSFAHVPEASTSFWPGLFQSNHESDNNNPIASPEVSLVPDVDRGTSAFPYLQPTSNIPMGFSRADFNDPNSSAEQRMCLDDVHPAQYCAMRHTLIPELETADFSASDTNDVYDIRTSSESDEDDVYPTFPNRNLHECEDRTRTRRHSIAAPRDNPCDEEWAVKWYPELEGKYPPGRRLQSVFNVAERWGMTLADAAEIMRNVELASEHGTEP